MISASFGEQKSMAMLWLEVYLWAAGAAIAFLALLPKYSIYISSHLSGRPSSVLESLTDSVWWLIPVVTLSGALAKAAKQRLESQWVWSVVKAIVDRICRDAFVWQPGVPEHFHRATLFKHVGYKWWPRPFRARFWPWGKHGRVRRPCSGWLVPVIRSGDTTQNTTTIFLAPDDDPDYAEGMAGHFWSMGRQGKAGGVGVPKVIDHSASNGEIAAYATQTRVSEDWIRKQLAAGKVLYASFCGIPIEVKGRTWGVLVLDSRAPDGALNAPVNMAQHAFVLGKLLERV